MESPEHKVFVGGLSWDYTDRELEAIFRRYGKVLDAKVMIDRNTGRPRGFGFVTFADEQGMREAIVELHNRELEGRIISVTKAQPRSFDRDNGYGGSDSYRGGGYGGGSSGGGGGRDECFKCGRVGHWARECPSGGGGGRVPRDRYEYSSSYGSDRYSERGRGRDSYGTRDRYGDGIGKSSRFSSGYGDKDRYGSGGPSRYERNSYRDRPTPYDRPSGRRSGYDDRY